VDIKLEKLNEELSTEGNELIKKLNNLGINNVNQGNLPWYLEQLRKSVEEKRQVCWKS